MNAATPYSIMALSERIEAIFRRVGMNAVQAQALTQVIVPLGLVWLATLAVGKVWS